MLIVFSGLPGVGKTGIARELARTIGAVHLRIDSIEQALRRAGYRGESEGYAGLDEVCAREGARRKTNAIHKRELRRRRPARKERPAM